MSAELAPVLAESVLSGPVPQETFLRRRLGLIAWDRERACPGLTLIASSFGGTTVRLVGLDGTVEHSWELPWPPGLGSRVTERGTLFACGKILDDEPFLAGLPFKGGAVAEFDRDGTLLWEVRYPSHHHDAIPLSGGTVMLLGLGQVPPEIAARVQGGIGDPDEPMYADTLVELDHDGRVLWEWRSWEHLEPELDTIGPGAMDRVEWTHGNGIAELPGGDLLVSLRQISTVIRVERATGRILQRIGAGELSGQHAPWLTDRGTVMLFDNGFNRQDGWPPYSRLVEFDLETGERVWEYTDPVRWEFFSALQSSAQPLPNGNVLACEGLTGRVFEITREGETVWEYVNPFLVTSPLHPEGARTNRMFRAQRVPAELLAGRVSPTVGGAR